MPSEHVTLTGYTRTEAVITFVALILGADGFIWFISGLDSRQVGSLLTTVGLVMYVMVLLFRRRRLTKKATGRSDGDAPQEPE